MCWGEDSLVPRSINLVLLFFTSNHFRVYSDNAQNTISTPGHMWSQLPHSPPSGAYSADHGGLWREPWNVQDTATRNNTPTQEYYTMLNTLNPPCRDNAFTPGL
jgi:hypothetical protein